MAQPKIREIPVVPQVVKSEEYDNVQKINDRNAKAALPNPAVWNDAKKAPVAPTPTPTPTSTK